MHTNTPDWTQGLKDTRAVNGLKANGFTSKLQVVAWLRSNPRTHIPNLGSGSIEKIAVWLSQFPQDEKALHAITEAISALNAYGYKVSPHSPNEPWSSGERPGT